MSSRKDNIDTIVSLFRLYEQKMYHIAFAILHDSYQAEDAVMDAFVRLLDRNYPIHDPASREAKSLVIQVIRSSAIDIYRKKTEGTGKAIPRRGSGRSFSRNNCRA